MNLQIAKWGNSLAMRIPAEYVRHLGVKEGDRVEAHVTLDGSISIRAAKRDRKGFARTLEATRAGIPMTESVTEELRRGGSY